MLVTFRSKSAADIVMLESHAKQILDVLNKDVKRGVVTEQEAGPAIAKLEAEFSFDKHSAPGSAADDSAEKSDDGADAPEQPVTTATHAYPFLEMLRAAHKDGHDVVWGV